MKKIIQRAYDKIQRNRPFTMAIFFILFFYTILAFFIASPGQDDLIFLQRLHDFGYWGAAKDHYLHWSSRSLIELALMFFSAHVWIWRLLHVLVMTGILLLANYFLFQKHKAQNLLYVFFFLNMMPPVVLSEAGWLATNLNYTWPLFCLFVAFVPMYRLFYQIKSSWIVWTLACVSAIFGTNQEQLNCAFLFLLLISSGYLLYQKIFSKNILFLLFISIVELLWSLTAPGNQLRLIKETKTWLPQFQHFGLVTKLDVGLTAFIKPFFLEFSLPFFLFFLALPLLAFIQNRSLWTTSISLVPLVANCFFIILPRLGNGFTYYGKSTNHLATTIQTVFSRYSATGTGLSFSAIRSWSLTFFSLFLLFSVIFTLSQLFSSKKLAWMTVALFLAAFGSRLLLGFSPTVWMSGLRTFYLIYVLIGMLSVIISSELSLLRPKWGKIYISLTITCALLNVLLFFLVSIP